VLPRCAPLCEFNCPLIFAVAFCVCLRHPARGGHLSARSSAGASLSTAIRARSCSRTYLRVLIDTSLPYGPAVAHLHLHVDLTHDCKAHARLLQLLHTNMSSGSIASRARRLTDTQIPASTKNHSSTAAPEHHSAHGGLISSSTSSLPSPGGYHRLRSGKLPALHAFHMAAAHDDVQGGTCADPAEIRLLKVSAIKQPSRVATRVVITCLMLSGWLAELLSVISCYGGGLESNKTIQVSWPAQPVSAQTVSAITKEAAAQAVSHATVAAATRMLLHSTTQLRSAVLQAAALQCSAGLPVNQSHASTTILYQHAVSSLMQYL